jgi:hypothetical protein
MNTNHWLLLGGSLSAAGAVAHLGIIAGGPAWYRFFHAGENFARAAQLGEWWPALVTLGIAAVLGVAAVYAFAGAGLLPRLPLQRTVLVFFGSIYLVRALALLPVIVLAPDRADSFIVWSSFVVLGYALCYIIGTAQAWRGLSPVS